LKLRRWPVQALIWLLIVVAAALVAAVVAARLDMFSGRQPEGLGVHDGRLKPPAKTPNSVSSQASLWPEHARRTDALIAPLALRGDGPTTIAKLARIIEGMAGARLVERRPDYLYAQFTTPLMRFVDDTEFWFDPAAKVVQVRSASRVGRGDLGANRARIEVIRTRLAGA
jgi:uncharacterized protein (DUF1499 family)